MALISDFCPIQSIGGSPKIGCIRCDLQLTHYTLAHHCLIMPSYSFEPEEDDLLGQLEEIYLEETFGDRLRLFYRQFSSSTRALLSDALFREIQTQGKISGLEILCPNEIVQRRLLQKQQKICNEVRWIWPDSMMRVEIWVSATPEMSLVHKSVLTVRL
jgi:hypothetical protein